jgi:predicted DCC family thiol-disulfide oxidoreductase YuxK
MTPIRDWDRFWFRENSSRALALYRIAYGLIILFVYFRLAPNLLTFLSDDGFIPAETMFNLIGRPATSLLLLNSSPLLVLTVYVAALATTLVFILGWKFRVVSVLHFLLLLTLHERNVFVLNSGDTLLRVMGFYFMFSAAGRAWSIDSLRASLGETPLSPSPRWAQQLMRLQVTLVYVATVYGKLRGADWHDGTAMHYVAGNLQLHLVDMSWLMGYPSLGALITYGTLVAELAIGLGLWFRKTRIYAVVIGVALHLGIGFTFAIPVFGLVMMSTYLLFLTDDEIDHWLDGAADRYAGKRALVFYDGRCGMCSGGQRIVQRLDLVGRTDWVNFRETDRMQAHPEIDLELAEKEMILLTPDGRQRIGYDAYRWMAWRIPAMWFLAPLMTLPVVSWIGRRVYAWVAANRFRLSGSDHTCSV